MHSSVDSGHSKYRMTMLYILAASADVFIILSCNLCHSTCAPSQPIHCQAGELEAAPPAASKPPAAAEPQPRPASDERRSRPAQPERQGSLRRQADGPAGSRADRKASEREADSEL